MKDDKWFKEQADKAIADYADPEGADLEAAIKKVMRAAVRRERQQTMKRLTYYRDKLGAPGDVFMVNRCIGHIRRVK